MEAGRDERLGGQSVSYSESLATKGWEHVLRWKCEKGGEDKSLCKKPQQSWVIHQTISAHDTNSRIVHIYRTVGRLVSLLLLFMEVVGEC